MRSLLLTNAGFIILGVSIFGFFLLARPNNQARDYETCAACHEDLVRAFLSKPHPVTGPNVCTSCHGKSEKHIEEGTAGTIFAFKLTDIPNEKSKMCLICHHRTQSTFLASPHGKSSMDCTSCHSIHAGKAESSHLKASTLQTCSSCHEEIFSQFALNERHRLQEGILSCITCHNPHEPATRERLAGFKNEACLKCHQDKGGPFLFEHGASRVEGCMACHEVHGSPNRHLLTHQSVSDLCFSCHAAAPAWHSRFDSRGTNCTSCHSTIHGSNLSKIFLK